MALRLAKLVLLSAAVASAQPIVLPPETSIAVPGVVDRSAFHTFDGFGALSAGASSRLLLDYPPGVRDDILDLLFTPGRGLALQILKVEIGAGVQSTDGSEVSIMPDGPGSVACDVDKNYELWLIREAKRRNPGILLGALEWGAPAWVKNATDKTLFSRENIVYVIEFLKCVSAVAGDAVHNLGIWNESPWGGLDYARSVRRALNAAGFERTELVLLDTINEVSPDFNELLASDPASITQLAPVKVGLHYTCTEDGIPGGKQLFDNLRRVNGGAKPAEYPLKVWASEEWSTPADWEGAGCLGRTINNNFVRMNITASIVWSLIWSVYPNEECFGQGLLYAFSPWSGRYQRNPTIYVVAHTTHFTKAGKSAILKAGTLEGGGSWIMYGTPSTEEDSKVATSAMPLTVVAETLHGACQYQGGCPAATPASVPQDLTLEGLCDGKCEFSVYRTNRTHWWVRSTLSTDAQGLLKVRVGVDEIVTVTNWGAGSDMAEHHAGAGSSHDGRSASASGALPLDAFPLPFSQDFDAPALENRRAPFFADQGGDFVVKSGELVQTMQSGMPIPWAAPGSKAEAPWTMVGDPNWTDVTVAVRARFDSWVALCGRVLRYQLRAPGAYAGYREGYCLTVNRTSGEAALYARDILLQRVSMTNGSGLQVRQQQEETLRPRLRKEAAKPTSSPTYRLKMVFHKTKLSAYVNNVVVAEDLVDVTYPMGNVGLGCLWDQPCAFDDLSVNPTSPPTSKSQSEVPDDQRLYTGLETLAFDYHTRSCIAQPSVVRLRNDFSGKVGVTFKVKRTVRAVALQRQHTSGNTRAHSLSLYVLVHTKTGGAMLARIAAVTVQMGAVQTGAAGEAGDHGWVTGSLDAPVVLKPGNLYALATSEVVGGDYWLDQGGKLLGVAAESVDIVGPLYKQQQSRKWHWRYDQTTFGPVNLVFKTDDPVLLP